MNSPTLPSCAGFLKREKRATYEPQKGPNARHLTFGAPWNSYSHTAPRERLQVRERKFSPKFFRPKSFRVDVRTGCPCQNALFSRIWSALTEVFGGASAGISGRKLPLWADFSFLTTVNRNIRGFQGRQQYLLTLDRSAASNIIYVRPGGGLEKHFKYWGPLDPHPNSPGGISYPQSSIYGTFLALKMASRKARDCA